MRRTLFLVLFCLGALLGSAGVASADEVGAKADSLASQIESPFCPGRTLNACTSSAAAEWRADIRKWVAEGVPPEEIKRRLEERAGRSLSTTSTPGMAYGTLFIISASSLLLLGFAYKKLFGKKAPDVLDEPVDDAESDELDDELDRELALMD